MTSHFSFQSPNSQINALGNLPSNDNEIALSIGQVLRCEYCGKSFKNWEEQDGRNIGNDWGKNWRNKKGMTTTSSEDWLSPIYSAWFLSRFVKRSRFFQGSKMNVEKHRELKFQRPQKSQYGLLNFQCNFTNTPLFIQFSMILVATTLCCLFFGSWLAFSKG